MAIDAAELASTSAASLVGGHGLYRDTVFPHIANDIRVLRVAGGSSEVLRNYIARRILKSETFEGLA
jgi:alkylation response protein AidB-like acyl-CoA dehydrogenase